MADLDLLRNVNNTFGHLAGDTVLTGIGRIIRETVREYDLPARFGGEEFCIVLLEAGRAEAQAFAERLRQAVQAADFEVATSPQPIHVTMSLGIACFPDDATTPTDLTHAADIAVYQAKLKGRNRVVCASDVPQSARLEGAPVEDAQATTYAAAFAPRQRPQKAVQARLWRHQQRNRNQLTRLWRRQQRNRNKLTRLSRRQAWHGFRGLWVG